MCAQLIPWCVQGFDFIRETSFSYTLLLWFAAENRSCFSTFNRRIHNTTRGSDIFLWPIATWILVYDLYPCFTTKPFYICLHWCMTCYFFSVICFWTCWIHIELMYLNDRLTVSARLRRSMQNVGFIFQELIVVEIRLITYFNF